VENAPQRTNHQPDTNKPTEPNAKDSDELKNRSSEPHNRNPNHNQQAHLNQLLNGVIPTTTICD
jgi:hypothetical protein